MTHDARTDATLLFCASLRVLRRDDDCRWVCAYVTRLEVGVCNGKVRRECETRYIMFRLAMMRAMQLSYLSTILGQSNGAAPSRTKLRLPSYPIPSHAHPHLNPKSQDFDMHPILLSVLPPLSTNRARPQCSFNLSLSPPGRLHPGG